MSDRTPGVSRGIGTPGATPVEDGINFAVVSEHADRVDVCLFDDQGERERLRLPLTRISDGMFAGLVHGIGVGAHYGFRADGPHDPQQGHWFDPAKLLADPYAKALDRPFIYRAELAAPRNAALDTAAFMPKAVVAAASQAGSQRPARPAEFIYEVSVRAFTHDHPDIPLALRGTIAGLAAPAIIEHLVKLGVRTVELMPIAAAVDERHLAALGLSNAWGYNPAAFMAPDPRLVPGGLGEVCATVAALHAADIAVALDAVFNHTGEGDASGPTLSLRGLDNALYYRRDSSGEPANDAGTGNTLAVEREPVIRLVLDAMRHWVLSTGIDGFRLDLAATLGRVNGGFQPGAPLFAAIEADDVLSRCTFIAEPWDVGWDGYQLGNFPHRWSEWNDRFRDDVRRFWRGDAGTAGALATRIAGSADVFGRRSPSASVNFLASHDGMALADIVAFNHKHNDANGEGNRDGTDANFSWNNGVEGATRDPAIVAARSRDLRALLATLFLSRGTPMLTAGDEFGRTQQGNNNAYAQDNATTWLDWNNIDGDLREFVGLLSRVREAHPALSVDRFLTGRPAGDLELPDVVWLSATGEMTSEDWHETRSFGAALCENGDRIAFWINGSDEPVDPHLPPPRLGCAWHCECDSAAPSGFPLGQGALQPRSVRIFAERPHGSR
jgi:glycogen operon protein